MTWNGIGLYAAIPENERVIAVRPPKKGDRFISPGGAIIHQAAFDYARTEVRIILAKKVKRFAVAPRLELPDGYSILIGGSIRMRNAAGHEKEIYFTWHEESEPCS